MVKQIHVEGYAALEQAVEEVKGQEIFVLFTGSAGPDGKSWCPDCIMAEPVIKQSLHAAPDDAVFIECSVGDRPFWKDPENVFRRKLGISCVPTLVRWGQPQRLEDMDCAKKELVEMLFEEP